MDIVIKYFVNITNSSRDWFDYVNLFFSILIPFSIAFVGWKISQRQNKKILEDNKVNRLANYNSNIILAESKNKSYIIFHLKTWHNYSELLPYKNVLLSNKEKNINGMTYAITINLAFKSIGKIIPTQCNIKKFMLYDTTDDKSKQKNSKQLCIDFINYYPNFRNITIDKDELIIVNFLCCVTNEQYNELKLYDATNKKLNFVMELKIKNQFNIVNECEVSGLFKQAKKENDGTNSLGGQKEKLVLKLDASYLTVKNIYEQAD